MKENEDRPLATEEQERLALDIFPISMSPGAYAAEHGDIEHGCFGYDRLRYRDERINRWLAAVARILGDPQLLERCRRRAGGGSGER